MKDMKKTMDKRKADDTADADASAQARAEASVRAPADEASRAAPTPAMSKASHDDMWATIETAVNVAVRKAESKFKIEREQLEQQVRHSPVPRAPGSHVCACPDVEGGGRAIDCGAARRHRHAAA